jgi:hypothetical protein
MSIEEIAAANLPRGSLSGLKPFRNPRLQISGG